MKYEDALDRVGKIYGAMDATDAIHDTPDEEAMEMALRALNFIEKLERISNIYPRSSNAQAHMAYARCLSDVKELWLREVQRMRAE